MNNVIENIWRENYKEFVKEIIETSGTSKKAKKANQVGTIVEDLLRNKNMMQEEYKPKFVDILRMAAMLHNVFYSEEDFTSLFGLRKFFDENQELIQKHNIDKEALDAICQSVEGQEWDQTKIALLKPSPGSPAEILAIAKWVANYIQ